MLAATFQPYCGEGLMSEALAALLSYGFEQLGLNKIYATHIGENPLRAG